MDESVITIIHVSALRKFFEHKWATPLLLPGQPDRWLTDMSHIIMEQTKGAFYSQILVFPNMDL